MFSAPSRIVATVPECHLPQSSFTLHQFWCPKGYAVDILDELQRTPRITLCVHQSEKIQFTREQKKSRWSQILPRFRASNRPTLQEKEFRDNPLANDQKNLTCVSLRSRYHKVWKPLSTTNVGSVTQCQRFQILHITGALQNTWNLTQKVHTGHEKFTKLLNSTRMLHWMHP